MSPPIREGSGDSIGAIRLGDGSEIAEVRTGAGDVLFSGSAIPDSVVNRTADDNTFSTTDKRGTQIQIASGESFGAFGVRISANTIGLTTAYLYDNDSTPNLITSVDISGLTSGDPFSIEAQFESDTIYNIVGDAGGNSYDSGFAQQTQTDSVSGSEFDITSGLSNINDTDTNFSNFNDLGNPDGVLD